MEVKTNEESLGEGTDFFTHPPIGLSEEENYYMKIHPTSSIDNNAPLIYEFDVDDSHYADLSNCYHYIKYRIMQGDRVSAIAPPAAGAAAGDAQKVAPINYFGNTLFQNIELYLNGELVETSNNLYPYKSFLQTFLSFGKDTKNTQLAVSGYYPDIGEIDTNAIRAAMPDEDCTNSGAHRRYKLSEYSQPFATLNPLHLDFCTQNRYVLNRTHVKIRLTRVDPNFGLIANADNRSFALVIPEAFLQIRMVRPRESLRLAVEEAMEHNLVKYPMKQCEMRFFTFSGTSNTISEPNLFSGHLPTRVAIGLVDTDAMDGHWQKSPFNFKHFNVTDVDFKVNGKSVPNDPIKIDMTHNDYVLPYTMLYKNTGGLFNNEALIDYEQYKHGHFLYVFDLTEDGDHDLDHFHQPKTGVISVDFRTSAPPNHSIAMIVMFEKEIILTCDNNRKYNLQG